MKNLNFEFTVNKETNTVHVTRDFNADAALVWDVFTRPELLDQWWAPQPWKSETKSMDFTEGGRRLYAMVGPEGERHWAIADFTSITLKTNFKYLDAFTDEEGNLKDEMPRSDWNLDFIDKGDTTTVDISIKHKTLADLEMIIQMGFKEGFSMTLNSLDELFEKIKK
ncbi:SRPBCC domain-containing protein [Flavobacterium sp. MFBS3-15]|uniref:SRPBCC family protein n=1 Tax=Flavobacterium sp. MFBS3-15 TaxID=2989816 RepID=UPI002236A2D4|nr:SRPBCC domain-containing protein [Flavobacterium sp. MFBS3-15]MCW4469774.1 SRPBCC domain-containing protein [Flavobacterium sp. MFBS3-15]